MGGLFSSDEYIPKYNPNEYNKQRPGKNIYFIDNKYVYWRGKKVNYANGLKFTDYGYGYGKDDKHIFYMGYILHDADLKSFKVLRNKLAIDKNFKYKNGKKINTKTSN